MQSAQLCSEMLARVDRGVIVLDAEGRIEVWSDWLATVSGIPVADAQGHRLEALFPTRSNARIERVVHAARTTGRSAVVSCALHGRPLLDSALAPPHSVVVHALVGPPARVLLIVRDCEAEVDFAERLEAVSAENVALQQALRMERRRFAQVTHFDPVTGLANRHQVRSYLARSIVRSLSDGRIGAFFILDIDHFADVNRSIGPQGADEVLRLVGARLTDTLRPTDMVGRIGSDEFAVVIESLEQLEDAELAARRVAAAFEDAFEVGAREICLTVSVGASAFPSEDGTVDDLLNNVEAALTLAKVEGGGAVRMYRDSMHVHPDRRFSMHAALRRAVDNGEFVLVYQPQVCYPYRALLGVEALIRWVHPERGLVPPNEFIPILEESGLINQVGAWVLWEACRQGTEWIRRGLGPLRVAVNVSARQFRNAEFRDMLAHTLAETGFSGQDLELELTESLLMQDVENSAQMLADFKDMGVRVAVDDFGTGYSSLAYLRRFPVDTLKIDRTFTREVSSNSDDLAICKTIVSLGKTLELEVLAEGVETGEQLEMLHQVGCDTFQGFYFGRPMPPDALEVWIDQNRGAPLPSVCGCGPCTRSLVSVTHASGMLDNALS